MPIHIARVLLGRKHLATVLEYKPSELQNPLPSYLKIARQDRRWDISINVALDNVCVVHRFEKAGKNT